MVNIIDDDIWKAEPALRPEDEIVLRKLHDMLQSTADDLKLLSGELAKYHEPGVQVKSSPTPLDEDFNEKVHIEELVNAKFHGYNVVDKFQPTPARTQRAEVKGLKPKPADTHKQKKVIDAGIQVNRVPIFRKSARKCNLTVSRPKVIHISDNVNSAVSGNEENSQQKEIINKPTVAYKELAFQYAEPTNKVTFSKPLQVQNMPSINIRGELREQKVLQLNIEPNATHSEQNDASKINIAVITVHHESVSDAKTVPIPNQVQYPVVPTATCSKQPIRKFSKMSSCESSEVDSHNNVNLVTHGFRKVRSYRATKAVSKLPQRQHSENIINKRNISCKKESAKHMNSNLDLWKKKLNAVYGCPTSSRKSKSIKPENVKKIEAKSSPASCGQRIKDQNILNNAEYIPYSKLTLGGARVSDIENELSGIPNRNDITLGPILNRILSRENSFDHGSPRIDDVESPNILTTSDENLLREVLNIEKKIKKTLTKNSNEQNAAFNKNQPLNDADDQDSYADDFEEEKSDISVHSEKQNQFSCNAHSDEINVDKPGDTNSENKSFKSNSKKENIQNTSYTKSLNLSFKKNVDVFEFVHNIDTQDTGTQSNATQKISLKETQTSPTSDKCNVQPIHNDLWPSIDPKEEVEKLFQLEKDFIKKLIIEEYGDLLHENFNKPSTSTSNQDNVKNVTAAQKNTQTSPAHVKSVMTSPTKTKTRTTSPLGLSLTVDQQTSPMQEEIKIIVEDGNDLGLSINLSSPRFSLRLPQTSREVISNLESHAKSNPHETKKFLREAKPGRENTISSSSSADGDYSSSDISSFGEIRFKLKRFRKLDVPVISDLSSSTSLSKYSSDNSDAIIPLRSEGELSLGQVSRKKSNKNIKSEGEASVGCL